MGIPHLLQQLWTKDNRVFKHFNTKKKKEFYRKYEIVWNDECLTNNTQSNHDGGEKRLGKGNTNLKRW